jgi:ATP-dependent helicase/nuclease subunit B
MTKNVMTIHAGVDFIRALSDGLLQRMKDNPFHLSDYHIYLPTRRACTLLRNQCLNALNNRAVLLPTMCPLGDVDDTEFYFTDADINPDIPPALSPLRRKILLTRLIRARDESMPYDQATQLATALAQLLDEVQINRQNFDKLSTLVQEQDLAQHWQQTVAFLEILVTEWPKILAEEGCLDPIDRRNRVMETQIAAWRTNPSTHPIIAAGSTGSQPVTADFLDAIASLPQGSVILPGLDCDLDEEAWQAIEDTHPQHALKDLLAHMKLERKDIKPWPYSNNQSNIARHRLIQQATLSTNVTDSWRDLSPTTIPPEAMHGLSRLEVNHMQEEAQAIALILRATLETPDKTAALVTPDRGLAERVSCLLKRWGVEANDSSGTPLATKPIGAFLLAVLKAAKPEATSIDWLSLLKHPLAAFGKSTAECRQQSRQLEIHTWRTDRPQDSDWLEFIKQQTSQLTKFWSTKRPLRGWIDAHTAVAVALASTDTEKGETRLWIDENGEKATEWLSLLRSATHDFPSLTGGDYALLIAELMQDVTCRPSFGYHPRLSILGLLEARLIQADVMILGGLNEGTWPPQITADPWMSRPMRKNFGLPVPEYRIGLAAHDFVQFINAPEVVLTRSRRSGNAPMVPSPFLLRLETVLRALGYSDKKKDSLKSQTPWIEWARMLDEPPAAAIWPNAAPEPRPPLEARPKTLSVTEIGTWQRNPYALYAKHILRLRKLDPLDAAIDASDRGQMIHSALEDFTKAFPDQLPPDAFDQLIAIGKKYFAAFAEHPEVNAFWWPRFETVAAWFVHFEMERRGEGIKVLHAEASGNIMLDDFILKGRADRIDRLPDGTLAIIDYKTGAAPNDADVQQGIEPQLPLLGLIATKGGFTAIPPSATSELSYWKLSGGRKAAETRLIKGDMKTLIEKSEVGLRNLIAVFDNSQMPYQAVPNPALAPRNDDYAHLARLREWGRTEGE